MTAVLDTNKGLTDHTRQTIMAALPRGVEPSEEFWRNGETAVAGFLLLQERRTRRPPKLELKRWQKIDGWCRNWGGDELRTVKRQTPWSAIDPLWPNRSLSALWPIKLRAESGVLCYQSLTGAFRGSSHSAPRLSVRRCVRSVAPAPGAKAKILAYGGRRTPRGAD